MIERPLTKSIAIFHTAKFPQYASNSLNRLLSKGARAVVKLEAHRRIARKLIGTIKALHSAIVKDNDTNPAPCFKTNHKANKLNIRMNNCPATGIILR